MQANPLILLTGAQKVFTTDSVVTLALDNVHLAISEGEFVAITGPSGAGKSTLLLVIALLEQLTAGEYWLCGHNVAGLAPNQLAYLRNRFVGVVFQQSLLIPDLPVWENVALPLKYRGLPVKERREQALEALAKVSLPHRAWHRPSQLSGGEQQRAAVARALVGKPKLIVADEPTGNLDSHHGREVMELFRVANQEGATVVLVTHDPQWAAWARRQVVLRDGKVVSDSGGQS
ncbi:MAG: ABC transporter ATP-binding protein [Thermoanaerobaculum sp.]